MGLTGLFPKPMEKSEIGLENVVNERQYSAQNPPPYPVTSVNGKTGDVTVDAVTEQNKNLDQKFWRGTKSEFDSIATKDPNILYMVEDKGDKWFVNSVNGKTGNVELKAADVKAAPKWNATTTYQVNEAVIHNGYLWRNTSGAATTGVEPGTNYNVWNVGFSNPNLLDNPWFTVNQRGETYYEGQAKYCLDRWWLQYDTNVRVNDGYITLSGRWQILQKFEKILPSATYTLSLIVNNKFGTDDLRLVATSSSGAEMIKHISGNISEKTTISFTFQGIDVEQIYFVFVGNTDNRIDIYAVKLELGPISTLANDVPPDYGEELAKCQRYFERVVLPQGYHVSRRQQASASLSFPFSVEKRIPPTLKKDARYIVRSSDNAGAYGALVLHTEDDYNTSTSGVHILYDSIITDPGDSYYLSDIGSLVYDFSADL